MGQSLRDAILSGFKAPELEQTVRLDLNQHLDIITSNGPLGEVVFDLILWAENRGLVEDLIRVVQRARPNNKKIESVAKSLLPQG
jgi:hypothetical protein